MIHREIVFRKAVKAFNRVYSLGNKLLNPKHIKKELFYKVYPILDKLTEEINGVNELVIKEEKVESCNSILLAISKAKKETRRLVDLTRIEVKHEKYVEVYWDELVNDLRIMVYKLQTELLKQIKKIEKWGIHE